MIARKWHGRYYYNNRSQQKLAGSDYTKFYIDLVFLSETRFTGTVTDDASTGGTPGIGNVSGTIVGDKIQFVKRMPVLEFTDRNARRTVGHKRHPNIYYSGALSPDARSMSGEWKFKWVIMFRGVLPCIMLAISGTWTAVPQNQDTQKDEGGNIV